MAIVQISQITNRKGLAENLPQLAGAELGWSTDTRQLWIGNGTLEEGAPVVGNTEILTEFSDLLNFSTTYTYKGLAAGYTVQTGPTPGTPVSLSLQSWLDQFASVLDFGAVGDGTTDCTAAINRALYQLYCREVNPQIRRSLFFPAGVYRVTGTINIPPYATLYGEGQDNSVISLTGGAAYVAQTADSRQQTGVNIGNGGATPPEHITITSLGFQTVDPEASVFLVGQAVNCRFQNVGFNGPMTTADLNTNANDTRCVDFYTTAVYSCEQIVFDGCVFDGTVYAFNVDEELRGITISNSQFDTLYQGILIGTGAPSTVAPTGIRVTNNLFDNIYVDGIVFGEYSNLNASAQNIFYDVGNHFTGADGTAYSPVVTFNNGNNVSIGDLFERSDALAADYPRIYLNVFNDIVSATNGSQIVLATGTYVRQSGSQTVLTNNSTNTVAEVSTLQATAFEINYKITRNNLHRVGTLTIASEETGPSCSDDYVQNGDTGITLSVGQVDTTVSVTYSATNTGINGIINYSINYLA